MLKYIPFIFLLLLIAACEPDQEPETEPVPDPEPEQYDLIITNGIVYDGSVNRGTETDIGIRDERIVEVGEIENMDGAEEILDAEGIAVTPGFINMLSWGAEPLIIDGRSMSGIKRTDCQGNDYSIRRMGKLLSDGRRLNVCRRGRCTEPHDASACVG